MNALAYAKLAELVYTDAPTIGAVDSASRMHIYGGVHVYRGTDDIMSALTDIDITCADTPYGRIHAGFWHAWLAIRIPCLARPTPEAIVGHSLGGALAILEAAERAAVGQIVPVYAFEPPRMCADDRLTRLFADLRVPWLATRNGNDIVTQIPPELSLPGPLTSIGRPVLPFDNAIDHRIAHVIAALQDTPYCSEATHVPILPA